MDGYPIPAAGAERPTGPSQPNARTPGARAAWLGILAAGIASFQVLRHALVASGNLNLAPALVLVGALTVPVSFTAFVYGRRLPFTVSGATLAGVGALGGVFGVVAASTLEYDSLTRLGGLSTFGVAVIEETAKLLVPAVVLLVAVRRLAVAPVDGLIVGVAAGAGFAVLETMGYAFVAMIKTRGDLTAVEDLLLLRGLLSPAAHMAWTGLTCAALWSAISAGWTLRSVLRLAGAFAVAVALHTIWDASGSIVGYIALSAVALGVLVYASIRIAAQVPIRFRA